MMVLCVGALIAGMAASLAIPFAPFAAALTLAAVLGAVWAALHGIGLGHVLFSAVGLLVSTQVGYGLGIVGTAAAGGIVGSLRRPAPTKPIPPGLSDLHIGEKH
jgi:hypothetical protein